MAEHHSVRNGLRWLCVVAVSATTLVLSAAPAYASTWAVGDVFLGVESGNYQVRDPSGALKETLNAGSGFTTGCAIDKAGNLYGTYFSDNKVVKFDNAHPHAATPFGSGYATPESIAFDAAGNVYVGNLGNGIRQYDAAGNFLKTVINTRVDWFDIAADQDTILYTQEGSDIKRVSIATGASLPDFTTGTAVHAYALRILPDGGVLLADQDNVKRYDSAGAVIQTYDVAGEDTWFSLNLDPNGTSFWAGNFGTANYYRFNIASGAVEVGPINTGTGSGSLFGICVFGELTAATSVLTLSPATAQNEVGQQHCVTATLKDQTTGQPKPNVTVVFAVSGANTASGTAVTDGNGQAQFCYTGTSAGQDTISAFADLNGNGAEDTNEPSTTATKTYVATVPADLVLSPKSATNTAGQQHCVTATVTTASGTPTPGKAVVFSVSGANSAGGTVVTDANGQAQFCYMGTTAGNDTITAFTDTNTNGIQDGGEPGDTASKTWVAGAPANLTLTPKTATNTVDAQHCVTATVTDQFGNPVPGVPVRFSVTGVSTDSGTVVTDSNGQAQFCFTSALPGGDTVTAFADTDGNGVQGTGEPADTASKVFVLPPSTAGCKVTGGGQITAANGDRANFGGNAQVAKDGTPTGEEEYMDHGPASPMNVHSTTIDAVVCSRDGTEASIFGTATIGGTGTFGFRIDVKDLGEPGSNDAYRIRLSNGYDSGQQTLNSGNIQIHL